MRRYDFALAFAAGVRPLLKDFLESKRGSCDRHIDHICASYFQRISAQDEKDNGNLSGAALDRDSRGRVHPSTNQNQTLYQSWARLVSAQMRATQSRQLRSFFTMRGMTEGFVVVKQVRQIAFEEFSRFLFKHWDDVKDWAEDRKDSNASNVLGKATSWAMRQQGLITYDMKVHSYNYSEFSLPGTVAANTLSPTKKAADNARRLQFHKDMLADENQMEQHFLKAIHKMEIDNYAEEMYKEAQIVKINALGVSFSTKEAQVARREAEREALEAERDGLIEHTGPLNDREKMILKILHTGYALKLGLSLSLSLSRSLSQCVCAVCARVCVRACVLACVCPRLLASFHADRMLRVSRRALHLHRHPELAGLHYRSTPAQLCVRAGVQG